MKTIFLDRDGVINQDLGYVSKWIDFIFINGSIEALQKLTNANYKIIIITNQSGIARGFYSNKEFKKLNYEFLNYCNNNEIKILDVFYCPHHKNGKVKKYTKDCNCRKPKPGMFLEASEKHGIGLEKSIMVGDKFTDILASTNAGIKKNYLLNSSESLNIPNTKANFNIRKNLLEVSNEILNSY